MTGLYRGVSGLALGVSLRIGASGLWNGATGLEDGGGPALSLDFTTGSLDSRITFTRSSGGTYFDASGVMQLASTNVARFDYDPSTLAAKGLLVEEQRANLLLNSLLDGTNLSTQSVTLSATAYTLSFYGTGTVTLSGASTAGPLVGTGANTRVSLTFTPTAGSVTFTVSGTVKWANLEAGSMPTSFIPTAGASATRSADNASMTGSNFSSWFNAREGTFVAYGIGNTASISRRLYSVSDGGGGNRIFANPFGNSITFGVVTSGVAQCYMGITGVSDGVAFKSAGAYKANDFASCINGGTVSTDTSGTIPPVDRITIGSENGGIYLNGPIEYLAYYNTRLPDATLQGLTT